MDKEQWLQGLRDAFSGTMKRRPVGHLQDSLTVSLGCTLRLHQGCNNYQPILSEGRSSQTEEMVVGNPPWQDPPAHADLILSPKSIPMPPAATSNCSSQGRSMWLLLWLPGDTSSHLYHNTGTLLSPQLCAV